MSMRKAINDKCKSCIYDSLAGGTWRQQVENCTITGCGLYPYRPKSSPKEKTAKSAQHQDSSGCLSTGCG